jgi:hypothetical protein
MATLAAIDLLRSEGLDVNVSVDPTAIGQLASDELCAPNAQRLARAVAAYPAGNTNPIVLDMEDLSRLEPTLRLHEQLLALGLPAAVPLQARLRRTEIDLRSLIGKARAVRLVKGAFPLGPEHDHQGRAAITASYLRLAEVMLSAEAKKSGLYPVFATQDDHLADRISILARSNGWQPDSTSSRCSTASASTGNTDSAPEGSPCASTFPSGRTGGPMQSAASVRTREICSSSAERSFTAAQHHHLNPLPSEPIAARTACRTGRRAPILRTSHAL